MNRFSPYLGIFAALSVGILIYISYEGIILLTPVSVTLTAPSTLPATTPVSTLPQKASALKPVATSSPTPPPQQISFDTPAVTLLRALVNIICYAPPKTGLRSVSASGVIIDPKGIILTNAHVAQYFLLADQGVSCVIRSGNPAVDRYEARLTYISPFWITANPDELTTPNPIGTGQYDFAFLGITGSATSEPLPASFPFVPLAPLSPTPGIPVVVASYGAQTLTSTQIKSDLRPTLALSRVSEVFTFSNDAIDVLTLTGSAAAQEGSSGGGVVNASSRLAATITTSAIEGDATARSIHAITASYVRSEYLQETGESLDHFLAQDPANSIQAFAPRVGPLESIIYRAAGN